MGETFIGAGMTRRCFSLGGGRCVKRAVAGREDAAALQNRAEYENFRLAEELGLSCFPKAYSLSDDGLELVEEEAWTANMVGSELETAASEVLAAAGCRFDDFRGKTRISVLMFALGCVVKSLRKSGIEYCTFAAVMNSPSSAISPSAALGMPEGTPQTEFFYTFDIGFLVSLARTVVRGTPGFETLPQLLRFTFEKRFDFALEDLWNKSQWGAIDGRLVVVDAGFSREAQESDHYRREHPSDVVPLGSGVRTTMPGDGDRTFNGMALSDMRDPKGNAVRSKFFTSKNTEYVLSDGGMSRRIKKAGLSDDGLHVWTDRLTFIGRDSLFEFMDVMRRNSGMFRPTRIDSDWKTWLTASSVNGTGEWEVSYSTNDISAVPEIGKHVLEFWFDGDGIVKGFHPGHDVSYIQEAV